jgi:hypothetical protein
MACLITLFLFPVGSRAHCDGLDGPVVKAARTALESGKIEPALIWIQPDGEAEVRAAFDHVKEVRKISADARDLADRYFYETLVRVHRAGENAPYTGLKPSGQKLPEAIRLADLAIENGDVAAVTSQLNKQVTDLIDKRFEAVQSAKKFEASNVDAGRAFVKAYVEFIHSVEAIHNTSEIQSAPGHGTPESSHAEPSAHGHH